MGKASPHRCAACGHEEEEGDALKMCVACMSVKYCNRECQLKHRAEHKEQCKRIAAELHERDMFKTPHREDCPICFLPLPIEMSDQQFQYCCGKMVCTGCIIYTMNEDKDDTFKCPFCRTPACIDDDAEYLRRIHKRIAAGDAEAMNALGCKYFDGHKGLARNAAKANEWWTKAAKLGNGAANRNLASSYLEGRGGFPKSLKKEKYHNELAAKAGHVLSRRRCGELEWNERNFERAYKHWFIAASAGCRGSLAEMKEGLELGMVTMDGYDRAVRAHDESLAAMKSGQRESLKMGALKAIIDGICP